MTILCLRASSANVLRFLVPLWVLVGCAGAPKPSDDTDAVDTDDTDVVDTVVDTDDTDVVDTDVVWTQDMLVARGKYLVLHNAGCPECHTPRNQDGTIDTDQYMGGSPSLTDYDGGDPLVGNLPTPNLTPDPDHGLGMWTDEQVKTAITTGVDDEGKPLWPKMPYFLYSNFSPRDLDSVVAYLRSLPAVDHDPGEKQAMPRELVTPPPPYPMSSMPESSLSPSDPHYADAQVGKYLVTVGGCLLCHAPFDEDGPYTIDTTHALEGGQGEDAAGMGLSVPPFPETIYSRNLTPDASGLYGWTVQDIANAIRLGVDRDGNGICPPMPVGPDGGLGGMTVDDAMAIGYYLTTIPAVFTPTYPECSIEP